MITAGARRATCGIHGSYEHFLAWDGDDVFLFDK
jgi:hypothetical protein